MTNDAFDSRIDGQTDGNGNGPVVLTEVLSLEKVFEALDAAEIPRDFLLNRDKCPSRHRHEQIAISIHGALVEVDAGIADLIRVMNRIEGVETLNSCENNDSYGYVEFRGPRSLDFAHEMIAAMRRNAAGIA